MIDIAAIPYAFVAGVMALVMLMGLGASLVMPNLNQWCKRFFNALFSVLTVGVCIYIFGEIAALRQDMALAVKACLFLESLLVAVPIPMITVFLLHSCGKDWRRSALFFVVIGVFAVWFVLLVFAQFTTMLYGFDEDLQMYRGPCFPLLIAPVLAISVINLLAVLLKKGELSQKRFTAFVVFLVSYAFSTSVQLFRPAYLLSHIAISISAFSMYWLILADLIEQYMHQQREIAHQRASILVLQMRPHFVYNTLTSIYYLCEKDPQKAQKVTMDFSTYLRKNFTAIASEEPIPFSSELEHTRAYLAVETAQYEDDLFVEYDTPHTWFQLPALTLQPIVENAIKHGLDPDSGPLHISVRTRYTEQGNEIVVEDDGLGFEAVDDGGPHIALENIRQRLEVMCKGILEIEPREGGGTVVRLTIP